MERYGTARQVRMGVVMRDVDWQAGIGVVK